MNARDRAWARLRAHRWASTLGVLVTLAVGILIGTLISYNVRGQDQVNSSDAQPITIPPAKVLTNDFSRIAKQIEPAVVNINTEGTMKHPEVRGMPSMPPDGGGGGGDDDQQNNPFQDFFNRFFGGQGGPQAAIPTKSLGSGVLVDPKGYIVTNRHVVEGADRIRVKLASDPEGSLGHDAKVVGVDQETDLAVIKINIDKPLPFAHLGNSDGMSVGDWVLAVGSPFGLNATVTAGIVSYIGRNIPGTLNQFQSFIQTDAAINPGNSGGPLVNMDGQVIGINTAIMTGGEGYEGVGFALPSNTVAQVYNALIGPEHKVIRGSIGVEFQAVPNPAVSRVYGNGRNGVTISNIVSGGPADEAGLKVGDTIVTVDGKPVKNGDALVADIASRKPGSKAAIGYLRDGKEMSTTVTIGSRTKLWGKQLGLEGAEGNEQAQPQESKLGVTVQNISSDMAQRLGIPQKGVIVTQVKPGSPADDWGLRRGDVLLQMNRQPINDEADFNRLTSGLKSGQDVVFLVRSGRGPNAGTAFLGGTLP